MLIKENPIPTSLEEFLPRYAVRDGCMAVDGIGLKLLIIDVRVAIPE